jgi:hypothetical protein
MNPDITVTRSSYEPGYNRNPEVTSVVTERRINPFSTLIERRSNLYHIMNCRIAHNQNLHRRNTYSRPRRRGK